MKLLSIVIPIYNVEKYLRECIESIVRQRRFSECEILLIDDGSKDDSGEICNHYSQKYTNIKAYHKENGGLSDARNYGLERSNGEYVLFLDSDDYLIDDALDNAWEVLAEKNIDVLLYDAVCVNEIDTKIENDAYRFVHRGLQKGKVYTGEQAIEVQLLAGRMQTTVWLGIYRREYLVSNELWFKKGILHEDELWTPIVMLKASAVKYLPEGIYIYRIRSNSITQGVNRDHSRNVESYIFIYDYLLRYYTEKVSDRRLASMMLNDLCGRYLFVIREWKFFDYPLLAKNIHYKEIGKYSTSFKNRIRALLLYLHIKISGK